MKLLIKRKLCFWNENKIALHYMLSLLFYYIFLSNRQQIINYRQFRYRCYKRSFPQSCFHILFCCNILNKIFLFCKICDTDARTSLVWIKSYLAMFHTSSAPDISLKNRIVRSLIKKYDRFKFRPKFYGRSTRRYIACKCSRRFRQQMAIVFYTL